MTEKDLARLATRARKEREEGRRMAQEPTDENQAERTAFNGPRKATMRREP